MVLAETTRRRARSLLVVLLVGAVLAPAVPAVAQDGGSGLGIQLVEVPADGADNPRARLYIVDALDPGATISRTIRVSNLSDTPQHVELYPVATDTEGGWTVADGRTGNELTGWIDVEPSRVTIAPHGSTEVVATIRVPGEASGGERYAAVIAEGEPRRAGEAVTVVSRVGVRVYLYVRGERAPVRDFRIDTLTGGRDAEGTPYVLIGVHNTGDTAIDPSGRLRLADGPGSLSAGPFDVALPRTIGPGGRGQLRVPLDPQLPAGPWRAVAELSSGEVDRTAEAQVTFPRAGQLGEPQPASPVEDRRRALIPAAGLLILLTLTGLLFFVLWRRRRDDEEDDDRDDDGGGPDLAAPAEAPTPAGV